MVCNAILNFFLYSATTVFWLKFLCASLSNLWQKGGVLVISYHANWYSVLCADICSAMCALLCDSSICLLDSEICSSSGGVDVCNAGGDVV
jgi:hypothetical protein